MCTCMRVHSLIMQPSLFSTCVIEQSWPQPARSPQLRYPPFVIMVKGGAAKAKGKHKQAASRGDEAEATPTGGYTNVCNHRHKLGYFYPHGNIATSSVAAMDLWLIGTLRAKNSAACPRLLVQTHRARTSNDEPHERHMQSTHRLPS